MFDTLNNLSSVQISTLSLGICPIISLINRKYDFLAFQSAIYITSILNHFKIYTPIRKLDILLVWLATIHHFIKCAPHFYYYKFVFLSWGSGLLYPISLYYKSDRIHSLMHYGYILSIILLNSKKSRI